MNATKSGSGRRGWAALWAGAALSIGGAADAQTWTESGDAGQLTSTAQVVTGSGAVTAINGSLSSVQDVDVYRFRINSPGTFSASTTGTSQFTIRVLALFSGTSGNGVTMSNAIFSVGQVGQISGQFFAQPGEYLLAMSSWEKLPLRSDGQPIWNENPNSFEVQPSGAGAPGPLATWNTTPFNQTVGSYSITLTGASRIVPAANDTCATATVVTVSGTTAIPYSTSTATTDAGIPGCGGIGSDIWYCFTAPTAGTYEVHTCANADYDSVVAVYGGTCGALTLLVCNDDSTTCGPSSTRSRITFNAQCGTVYYVRVGGFSAARGNGTVTINPASCSPPVVTQQPPALTHTKIGLSVSFAALVTGTLPITYEWRCLGEEFPVPGETGPTLTIPVVAGTHQNSYYLVARNCCGQAMSHSAQLFVSPDGSRRPSVVGFNPPTAWQRDERPNDAPDGPPDGLIDWIGDSSPANRIADSIDQNPSASGEVLICLGRNVQQAFFDRITAMGHGPKVRHVLHILSVLHGVGFSYAQLQQLAADEQLINLSLFVIMPNTTFHKRSDVSVPSLGVTPGFYSPNTIQERDPWVDGSGVNVAVLDSGVDNPGSMIDATTPSSPFLLSNALPTSVFGYDVVRDMALPPLVPPSNALRIEAQYDPDDNDAQGHGTHAASIVLGRGIAGQVPRGVAPGANLIDVKVLDQNGLTSSAVLIRAIEVIWGHQASLGAVIDVVYFGFVADVPEDEVAAVSQLLDIVSAWPGSRLSTTVIVAPAGDDTDYDTESRLKRLPASHRAVIAVGASDDRNTQNRADDTLWSFTPAGPRRLTALDAGQYTREHLRPQIVAPGVNIVAAASNTQSGTRSLTGTSMAAAHVAGLAALYLEAGSTDPLLAMTSTAALPAGVSGFGGPFAGGQAPDRPWNERWGYGKVDGFAGLDSFIDRSTNLGFARANGSQSVDGSAFFYPFGIGCDGHALIRVRVKNFGAVYPANNVRVYFGTVPGRLANSPISDGSNPYLPGGSWQQVAPAILPGQMQEFDVVVQMPRSYRPRRGWRDRALGRHNYSARYRRCDFDLSATITSPSDSSTWDNRAHISTTVHASPNVFELANHFTSGPALFTFVVTPGTPNSLWALEIDPPSVTLRPEDPLAIISVLPIPPQSAPDGATETFTITTMLGGEVVGQLTTLATKHDCNGNGCDDWFDIEGRAGCPIVSLDTNEDGIPDECQCIADVDDGTGTGTRDGGVTIEDLLYYLGIFDLGLPAADVDDGSGTSSPDGGVTIEDLLYYLLRFDGGC